MICGKKSKQYVSNRNDKRRGTRMLNGNKTNERKKNTSNSFPSNKF